jgi:hypothetical protein
VSRAGVPVCRPTQTTSAPIAHRHAGFPPPTLVLATIALLTVPLPLTAQHLTPSSARQCQPRRSELAVEETLALNLFVNRVDAWVFNEDWAKVDFEDWSRNLGLGWEWDENAFATNMFAHPFHGAAYFNAGRSNCLSYWESVPLAFLGSWTWEFFGETYRPSFNDFLMTSFGGIALGEITHRVAATIRDETATGGDRLLREIGAFVINPVEGINRLFRGEWGRVGSNPTEHDPGAFLFRLNLGARSIIDDSTDVRTSSPMIQLDIRYGDPFERAYREPFDVFSLRAQVAPGGGGLNLIEGSGRLYQKALDRGGAARHAMIINHRYEYLHKPVYQYGAQSVELGIISHWPLSAHSRLRTRISTDMIMLGAIDAPIAGFGERSYDFGPGGGATVEIAFERNGKPALTLNNRLEYLHTVSGARANHLVAFSSLEAHVTLGHTLGVGLEVSAANRTSKYEDGLERRNDFGEARLFLSWSSFTAPRTTP